MRHRFECANCGKLFDTEEQCQRHETLCFNPGTPTEEALRCRMDYDHPGRVVVSRFLARRYEHGCPVAQTYRCDGTLRSDVSGTFIYSLASKDTVEGMCKRLAGNMGRRLRGKRKEALGAAKDCLAKLRELKQLVVVDETGAKVKEEAK